LKRVKVPVTDRQFPPEVLMVNDDMGEITIKMKFIDRYEAGRFYNEALVAGWRRYRGFSLDLLVDSKKKARA